jgi:hypothetical protein
MSFVVVVALFFSAADPDALTLMRDSDKRHRLPNERTQLAMVLQEKGGPERARGLQIAVRQDLKKLVGGDRQWIRFDAPGDIKGTQLLTVEKDTGDNDQWLFLSGFAKSRRVGSAELGDRFVGTDFFFEDLKHRVVDDYAWKLLGSEADNGVDCWKIESVPLAPRAKTQSPYARSELWMRKDNLFVVKTRFFDKQGKALKEYRAENLVKVAGNAWRADRQTMIDVQRNHKTVVVVKARDASSAIPDDTFHPFNLKP